MSRQPILAFGGAPRRANRGDGASAPLKTLLSETVGGADLPVQWRLWEDRDRIGPPDAPVKVAIRSRDALVRMLQRPGQLGLARAYVAGDLDVEGDLVEALHILSGLKGTRLSTRQWLEAARIVGPAGLVPKAPPPEEVRLHGPVHSIRRDGAAIAHHYDLSNDFYALVLGPSMTYSCACWEDPGYTLEEAQEAKHRLVATKLGVGEGERLLDVGCGWGAMVEHAVTRRGATAVGVTISARQREWAARRLRDAGERAEIRQQDYRLIDDGPYDAICSIGMSEHVGEANLPGYFSRLYSLLRPGGRLLNHAISAIPAGRVPADWPSPVPLPRRRPAAGFAPASFTSRYIFPDGELVEVGSVVSAMQRAGFEVRHVETLREHYGLTLRRWLSNLEGNWHQAVAIVGQRRARAWKLYLAGSAFGFDTARVGVHQVLAVRPDGGRSGMPLRPSFT